MVPLQRKHHHSREGVRRGLLALIVLAATGCTPTPPPRWAQGGAPLAIGAARWERGDEATVEILANGQVLEDGEPIFLVDRVGRVVDDDYDPVAILLDDGFLAGPDDRLLGRVGISNAAPPHSGTAWLAVLPNGQVLFFDEDGERHNGGRWIGCEGAKQRTCTLVTHMYVVRHYHERDHGPRFGVGVGVGVGF